MLDRVSNSPANLLATIVSKKASTGLWVISGPSGAGKTKLCADMTAQTQENGVTVGGLICPAVFEGGKKIGIDLLDISSGKRQRLATHSCDMDNSTIGCWQMDESMIAWGNQILTGLKDEDVIVIDEIGPLEFEKGCGFQEALRLLDEDRYRTALVAVRPALLTRACSRWPQAQVLMLEKEGA